ncbi:MAG TPA: hypothetical protein EYM97_00775 [Gemmatimonadetes bacterium]|nr:hypothetical protein [Gemmatimonadota bacterium]
MGAWEDGFAAGWRAYELKSMGLTEAGIRSGQDVAILSQPAMDPKRRASAYSKRYGAAFKRLAKKNKKKSGGWKKGGFARTQKAAHRAAKR